MRIPNSGRRAGELLAREGEGESEKLSTCFDPCNTAYERAQTIGYTPILCDSDGEWRGLYDVCTACVADLNDPDTKTLVDSLLGPFINYCAAIPNDEEESSTLLLSQSSYFVTDTMGLPTGPPTLLPTGLPSQVPIPTTAIETFSTIVTAPTVPANGTQPHKTTTTQMMGTIPTESITGSMTGILVPSYTPEPEETPWSSVSIGYTDPAELSSLWRSFGDMASSLGVAVVPTSLLIVETTTSSMTSTLSNGEVVHVPVTKTNTKPNLSAWGYTQTPTAAPEGLENMGSLSLDNTAKPGSNAWIAGPIVGALTALILLLWGTWWYLKKRRRLAAEEARKEVSSTGSESPGEFGKAQLHSECVSQLPSEYGSPREMLAAEVAEMDTATAKAEMLANEVAAIEMPLGTVYAELPGTGMSHVELPGHEANMWCPEEKEIMGLGSDTEESVDLYRASTARESRDGSDDGSTRNRGENDDRLARQRSGSDDTMVSPMSTSVAGSGRSDDGRLQPARDFEDLVVSPVSSVR